jgi:predicted metal-binding membrane protein
MMSIQMRSRDKFAIGALLASVSLVAWASTIYQAQAMPIEATMALGAHHPMSHAPGSIFSPVPFLIFLGAWIVMMTAMMLPSAAPMVMTYAAVSQQRGSSRPTHMPTGLFVLGYLLAWGSSGLLAYAVSALASLAVMTTPGLQADAPLFGGMVLILAGAYQFSALKAKCLSYCRTPLGYILSHWRAGYRGALRMGLHHGLYCIGCCWALMAIMFVVGIMNLAWMALLALFMFIEKASARGEIVGKIVGALLIIVGMVMAASSLL